MIEINLLNFQMEKKNGNFLEKKMNRLEWKEIRFLLIAFYKEDPKTCLIARLPKDIIKEISNQETISEKNFEMKLKKQKN